MKKSIIFWNIIFTGLTLIYPIVFLVLYLVLTVTMILVTLDEDDASFNSEIRKYVLVSYLTLPVIFLLIWPAIQKFNRWLDRK